MKEIYNFITSIPFNFYLSFSQNNDNMDISSHFIKGMNIPPTFEKTICEKME